MKNFASTKNALIVTGLPKTGSHLTMSILDSFGFERAEDLGDENGITSMPFDFQHKLVGRDAKTTGQGCPLSPERLLELTHP